MDSRGGVDNDLVRAVSVLGDAFGDTGGAAGLPFLISDVVDVECRELQA